MKVPLFIIFVNSNLSTKLVNLILQGKIHALIYSPYPISLKLKKVFLKSSPQSFFKIIDLNIPYNYITFNLLLTSKSFWDNIPSNYLNLFVLYNPRALALSFLLKNKYSKPFFIIPFKKNTNINKLIMKNPSLVDEQLAQGFLFYINNKFAKKTIKNFSKKQLLNIRKEYKMQNNEHVERNYITPFYLYFTHNLLNLGYDL